MGDLIKLLAFMRRLAKDVPKSQLMMAAVIFAGILSGLANTGMIAVINSAFTKGNFSDPRVGWRFVGLCLALPGFRLMSQVALIHFSQRSMLGLRLSLSRRILKAPLRQIERIGPARLFNVLTTDIGAIIDALVQLPLMFMHLAIFVSCLAYLGWLSWEALAQVLIAIVVGILAYRLPMSRALGHFRRSRQKLDVLVGHLRSLTEGAKELKMHGFRREAYLEDVEAGAQAVQKETRAGGILFAGASSFGQALFFVVTGLLLFVMPRYQHLSTSTLIGFTIVLFHLMTPLELLLNSFNTIGRAVTSSLSIERLGLSLAEGVMEVETTSDIVLDTSWKDISLSGVEHTYLGEAEDGDAESFKLGPIDLTFRPGELVFLVGGNGSGKTTLAKLLLGLYVPEKGELRFDGRLIDNQNRSYYRDHFSSVFSDFFLFERLLGLNKPVIDADAKKLLEELRLANKVKVEEGKLSTLDLSQGQRKRLALLTAYLEDRPIYLFDEWAADQDPTFKEIFYLELLPKLRDSGKTVLVISHDDHYYRVADRIIKLDYGKVEYDRRCETPARHRIDLGGTPT